MAGIGVVMANDNDKNDKDKIEDDVWDGIPDSNKSDSISPQEAMRKGKAALQGKLQGANTTDTSNVSPAVGAPSAAALSDVQKQSIIQLLQAFNITASFNAASQIKLTIAKKTAELRVNGILMQYGLANNKVPNLQKVNEILNNQAKQDELKAALAEVLEEPKQEAQANVVSVVEPKAADVAPVVKKMPAAKPSGMPQGNVLSDSERNKVLGRRVAIETEEPALTQPKGGLPPLPEVPGNAIPAAPKVVVMPLLPNVPGPVRPAPQQPAAPVAAQAAPKDPQAAKKMRAMRAEELGKTEDSYLSSLQFMLDNKERFFKNKAFNNLKRPQKQIIRELIDLAEQITKANASLQAAFKQLHTQMAQQPENPKDIQQTLSSIAQLMGPTMELQSKYFALFESQYKPMLGDPKVQEALDEAAKFNLSQKENEIINLGTVLIMPVQRGTRYKDMFEALNKHIDTSIPYKSDVTNIVEGLADRLDAANVELRMAQLKILRDIIYEGKISLPLLQQYARAKIKEEQSHDYDTSKAVLKELKALENANPVLSKALHQFAEVYIGWRIDLFKPAAEIGVTFPEFASREKSTLSRPAIETRGDIQINVNIENSAERKAIKSRLRYAEADIIGALNGRGLPAGLKIVAAKKELGVKADFIVQDANNNNVLHIVVDRNQLRVRELKGEQLTDDAKLALMHTLTHAIKSDAANAVVVSNNLDKIRRLNEIAVNAHGETYEQSTEDKRLLHKRIENDTSSHTSRMLYPHIEITSAGKKPEDVKNSFIKVIMQGSFVPKVVNPNSNIVTLFSGDVTIGTDIPLLAIKQYNAALEAGMTPKFTKDAKKKVEEFVKKQLNNNNGDTQITIDVPPGSSQISGKQVLQRLTQASNDGFISALNPQAQTELKSHIHALAPTDPTLQYVIPQKHSHPVELVNSLLGKGLLPNKEALGEKLRELRQQMQEDALVNTHPLIIDSGNQARDFQVLKAATEDLGIKAGISVANVKKMRKQVGEGNLETIDLKHIPAKEQVNYVKQLAEWGIAANFTAPVKQGERILILSKNKDHTRMMFEKYLNQGFLPNSDKRIKELSESGAYIRIEGNDPKVLWERIKHCSMSGLKIQLSPEQIKLMQTFSEKHNPALPIHGHNWGTVKYNIELANQLGMNIQGLSETAQAAYFNAQATEKQNGREMPVIDIKPIQVTEKRFLRSDRQVNDKERTKQFAEMLLKYGVNLSVSPLVVMKAEAENEATKTKWFGLSKTPTDKAVKAQIFLKNMKSIEENIQTKKSEFSQATVASLQAKANGLAPDTNPKKAADPSAVVSLASSGATNRQQLLLSDGARVMPAAQAAADTVASEVTLDEVVAKFNAMRSKARSDFDFKIDYRNPTRVFDNADKICSALDQIKLKSPAEQMVNLRDLLAELANGNHGQLFGQKAVGYMLDDSVKTEAKAFLDRISVVSKMNIKPSGSSM